jgi:hypothetical protein
MLNPVDREALETWKASVEQTMVWEDVDLPGMRFEVRDGELHLSPAAYASVRRYLRDEGTDPDLRETRRGSLN